MRDSRHYAYRGPAKALKKMKLRDPTTQRGRTTPRGKRGKNLNDCNQT